MRTIGMRDFQRDFSKQIQDLPLTVAKNKQDLFVVLSVGEYEKLTTIQRKVATSSPQPKVITPEVLDQFKRIETCAWIGCNKEVVGHDKINGRGFCKEHI